MTTDEQSHVLIIGASGGVGKALIEHYLNQDWRVTAWSRNPIEVTHDALSCVQVQGYQPAQISDALAELDDVQGVISTLGVLHNDDFMPEKQLDAVNAEQLQASFQVNAILPILLLQQLLPKLPRKQPAFWVQLSAKVGSITDNYLGGWYSYRASKAALNMLLKTASVELGRSHKKLVIAAIHPGTTDTQLSKPFQERLPQDKLYSPAKSASRIAAVIADLTTDDSGKLLHWDGTELPY
ncbi:SDR family NAD(P)-dependent oxidoreductase [Pseudidiomarina sp. 1APR75-33.1]|uniref:SDR family NAD(P)-dependent oxidoreductase n=1 Tax=Pseudidiomarina terrestris TaxID=2820060 RepID=UPI00264A7550|nr:SDR family NAD(P)-dependent oxidoreductase [Pseudidiomarina sp. 1APR75-33.1]MDN7125878.1 SDR family NAD(P)-dependent oxidoreductase [Pseudidiomarina sp. 1APR75-33.1]